MVLAKKLMVVHAGRGVGQSHILLALAYGCTCRARCGIVSCWHWLMVVPARCGLVSHPAGIGLWLYMQGAVWTSLTSCWHWLMVVHAGRGLGQSHILHVQP